MQENTASDREPVDNRPNLFLIGAPKCGTSALADILARHPEIFMAVKEPRFFDAEIFHDRADDYPLKDMASYLALFSGEAAGRSRYRLDASVFVMYSAGAIRRILEMNPSAKFIVMLRDPVTATKSMFLQRLKYVNPAMREVSDDFRVCWRLLNARRRGEGFPPDCVNRNLFRYDFLYHYERHLPQALEVAGEENIHIMSYEAFSASPQDSIAGLMDFLGLEAGGSGSSRVVNPSFALSDSPWNELLDRAIRMTAPLRRALGLNGKLAQRLYRLSRVFYKKQNIEIPSDCDREMKAEFADTYAYMASLFGCDGMAK